MKKTLTSLLIISLLAVTGNAQKVKFGKVTKEELQEKHHPLDSTADAAYLYRYRKTSFVFNESKMDFEVLTEYHHKIKIYTNDGFDYANRQLPYYYPESGIDEKITSIKAYTYNLENGKIKKEKLDKDAIYKERKNKYWSLKKFSMPNIKEGCVIEISYKLTSPYWDIRELQFQSEIPTKQLYYRTDIPEYFIFNKRAKGYYSVLPKIKYRSENIHWTSTTRVGESTFTPNKTEYSLHSISYKTESNTYVANDIPPLKDDEPYVSNIKNYQGGMKYELAATEFPNSVRESYTTSWEAIAKKIFQSSYFGAELKKTSYFKKDIEGITSLTSDKEKINSVLALVKSKVKWNGYLSKYASDGVKKAYHDGVGNSAEINLILVSILREVGLNAHPVLISTRSNGISIFPTREGLNTVIAAVKHAPGNYTLLDATETYSAPNILPLRDLNWEGRLITKEGNSIPIPLTPNTYTEEKHRLNISFDEKLNIKGMLNSSYTGLNALHLRNRYNHLSEEEVIAKFEEKYAIEIDKFRINNASNLTKTLSYSAMFTSDGLVETINNKVYINPTLFFTRNKNPFTLENRAYPVDYGTPWKDSYNIDIQVPEGYAIESCPESYGVGLSDNLGVFKFQTIQTPTRIRVITTIEINNAIVVPNYYKELKNFYKEMIAKQTEKIVFVKKS